MSPELWTTIGLTITTLGGIAAAHVSTRRKVDATVGEVGERVEEVRVLAAPTGNGFARRTTDALERIERRLALVDERQARSDAALVQHLTDHAHQEDS